MKQVNIPGGIYCEGGRGRELYWRATVVQFKRVGVCSSKSVRTLQH